MSKAKKNAMAEALAELDKAFEESFVSHSYLFVDELGIGDTVVTASSRDGRILKTATVKDIDNDPNHLSTWRNHRIIELSNGNRGVYFNGAKLRVA